MDIANIFYYDIREMRSRAKTLKEQTGKNDQSSRKALLYRFIDASKRE